MIRLKQYRAIEQTEETNHKSVLFEAKNKKEAHYWLINHLDLSKKWTIWERII